MKPIEKRLQQLEQVSGYLGSGPIKYLAAVRLN
jgi:hypothetical protein